MVISSIDFEEVPRQNWHGETLRWSEGEDSFLALLVSLSLWTCSSPLHLWPQPPFYPVLKFHRHTSVLLFQSLLLNLNFSPSFTQSVHISLRWDHLMNYYPILLFTHIYAGPQIAGPSRLWGELESKFFGLRMQTELKWAWMDFSKEMEVDISWLME